MQAKVKTHSHRIYINVVATIDTVVNTKTRYFTSWDEALHMGINIKSFRQVPMKGLRVLKTSCTHSINTLGDVLINVNLLRNSGEDGLCKYFVTLLRFLRLALMSS